MCCNVSAVFSFKSCTFQNLLKIFGQQVTGNTEDPDLTAPKEQSDQSLQCLLTEL